MTDPSTASADRALDIVVPLYNEQEALILFHQQLTQVVSQLSYATRILYVDDGSTDATADILQRLAQADPRVTLISLSRNFGHQAALTAGLDASSAEVVITMDGDGQHPPELIPQMLALYESGYDVVITQRVENSQGHRFKRDTSALFYRLINRIGDTQIVPGSADFRLTARQVVDAIKTMREYQRFLRGMVAWMGYKTVILPYTPPERLAGKSKYSLRKMLALATDAIFSFSLVPLQIGLLVGAGFFLLAFLEVIYVLSLWLTGQTGVLAPGWSSLMFMLLIVGGTLTMLLSFAGIYIGYIFQEVKDRPIYLVKHPRPTPPGTDETPEG
jgi:dolichol-phosphate mannosyltransferase